MIRRKFLDLLTRLLHCANYWARHHDLPLSTLSRRVANDGKTLDRLKNSSASCTTATLENFGRYLCAPESWSGGQVPGDVVEFGIILGLSQDLTVPASGKPADVTADPDEVAA